MVNLRNGGSEFGLNMAENMKLTLITPNVKKGLQTVDQDEAAHMEPPHLDPHSLLYSL